MKKLLILLSTLLITTNSYAMWFCQAINAKGEVFTGSNKEQYLAAQNTMAFCMNNSAFSWGRTCNLRLCQKDVYPQAPSNPALFAPVIFSWAN